MASRAIIFNMGPVNSPGISKPPGDIGAVAWVDRPTIVTISGNGSSYFSGLAGQYADAQGHILPNLAKAYHYNLADYDFVGLSGFSAGHGLAGPILQHDGDMVNAAVMFDSCFTGKGPPDHPSNGKDGYASFGARAIRGEKLFVLTSSHGQNGPELVASSTGSQCAAESFRRAMAIAGGSDEPFVPPPGVTTTAAKNFYGPGVLETHRDGNYFWLDYGPLFYHGDHINLLSRDILSAFMAPYIATGQVPGLTDQGGLGGLTTSFSRMPPWQIVLGVAMAGAAIYGGVRLAKRGGLKRNPLRLAA